MSIDRRSRRWRDVRAIPCDEVFETVLPEAALQNGELAARGLRYKQLPALPGDVPPEPPQRELRAARARLTNVQDRIAASGGGVKI